MNEDPEQQSPEATPPDDSPEPLDEPRLDPYYEPRPFKSAGAGFLIAGLIAMGIAVVGLMTLPIGFFLVLLSGPIAGVGLWYAYRQTRHYFARGALVFGIVSFLTVGVCFVGVFSSL